MREPAGGGLATLIAATVVWSPEIVESAFADVDGTVLAAQARHASEGDETGVDILDLLAAAIDKAGRGH